MYHRSRPAVRLLGLLVAAATVIVGPPGAALAAPGRTSTSVTSTRAAAAPAAIDLARGRTATTSGAQAGHPASAGNDGDAVTRWCAANGKTGQWWQVDLGAAAQLIGTEITWEFARDYRYRVETSTDATTWTTAADRTATAGSTQVRADAFTARARYVRVTVTGLPASTWASFAEIRVLGTPVTAPTGPEPDPQLRTRCTGTAPISCHFDLAPGNYDVTVILGDPGRAAVTSVQAEARRVLLGSTATAAGELRRVGFTVNVRDPEGQPTGEGGVGTPGLDLVFAGTAPALNGLGIVRVAQPPVLYLAGDSTVCDQPVAPYTGWGQQLPQYVGPGLAVANYADSGESSGSFLNSSKLFPTMRPLIRPGDVTLIQFGHNDKTTTAADFTANLTALVNGVRAQGGSPVLVTPPVRHQFTDGTLNATGLHVNGVGVDLPAVMRKVAADDGVPLIDLTARSRTLVEGLGETASAQLYLREAVDGVTDNTHFSSYGANAMAGLVLDGIRAAGLSALLPYLRS